MTKDHPDQRPPLCKTTFETIPLVNTKAQSSFEDSFLKNFPTIASYFQVTDPLAKEHPSTKFISAGVLRPYQKWGYFSFCWGTWFHL